MNFEIKLDKQKFRAFEIAMRKMPKETSAAIGRGLTTGLHQTAGAVRRRVGNGSILKRRSGHLTDAIKAYKDNPGDFYGYIGVGNDTTVAPYAYLLGEKDLVLIEAKDKLLTIPIGAGLTESGVARYDSPRDVPDGFWFKSKAGNILFGRTVPGFSFFGRATTKGHLEILFIGKESVIVETSGILPDVIEERIPNMHRSIKKEIMKTIVKLGIR